MAKRSYVPLFWALFSGGGVVAALLLPVHAFLFGIAFPLGWISSPSHERLFALLQSPLTRVYLLVLCVLSLFHWAHRFRYTLSDAAQVKHLDGVIAKLMYGSATAGSVVAVYLLLNVG
jgi:fumarate reductase subunit D